MITIKGSVNSSVCCLAVASVVSNCYVLDKTRYVLGGRRVNLSQWSGGSDSDQATGLNLDNRLVGHCKILAWQWAKLPRYRREGAVEVRPFPAEKRPCVSEAQGLSGEAMKGNPTTTVILRVDECKSGP
jgi:hypothetical protein